MTAPEATELAAYQAAVARALALIETSAEAFLPTTSNNIHLAASVLRDVHNPTGTVPQAVTCVRTEYGLLDADDIPGVLRIAARDYREAELVAADWPDQIVQRTVTTTTTEWTPAEGGAK